MLTDRAIKNLKPTDKHQFVADGNGLYLRVHPTGTKSWVHRSRTGGKARWTKIGVYPSTSLLDARKRVLAIADGQPPEVVTFGAAYNEYYERVAIRQYDRPDIIHQRVRANLLPTLQARALGSITRVELGSLLQKIVDRGAPVMANRTLSDLKHIFDYAVERGWLTDSPADRITRKIAGGKEKPRDVVLSFDAIESFLQMLYDEFHGKRGMSPATIGALYLCLLLGQRATEVLDIMRTWTGERVVIVKTKIRPAHKVHLPIQARAVLNLCRGLPLPKDHRVLSHALRRASAGFTPHDLRRTFATRLADMGVAPHVVEKILDHQMSGVLAVYNHAEYLPERQAAMRLWGLKVAALRRKAYSANAARSR